MKVFKDSYHISCCVSKNRLKSPVGNQAEIKNLAIGTWTDSNGNDPVINNGTTAQIYGVDIPPKEDKK